MPKLKRTNCHRTSKDVKVLNSGNCVCNKTHWCVEAEFVVYNNSAEHFLLLKTSENYKLSYMQNAINFNKNTMLTINYCESLKELMIMSNTSHVEQLVTSAIKRFNFKKLPIKYNKSFFSVFIDENHGLFPMYKSMYDSTLQTHKCAITYNFRHDIVLTHKTTINKF